MAGGWFSKTHVLFTSITRCYGNIQNSKEIFKSAKQRSWWWPAIFGAGGALSLKMRNFDG